MTVAGRDGAPRVALLHDWLTGMRGGEKVLEVLCELFPAAEIFTLVHTRGNVSAAIEGRRVHVSLANALPVTRRRYRHLLPLYPTMVEWFDLDGFDLVISSSHCAVKSAVVPGRARHVCYCHTPMRYAWNQFDSYFGPERIGPVASRVMRRVMARLARWDRATAGRVDRYLANSQHVARRIRRYYNRRASVVYPPVDTRFFRPDHAKPDPFFLIVSALVPYKCIETAIEACRLVDAPLRVVGEGSERSRLQALGGPNVTFLGRLPDEDVRTLYQRATAVLLPGEEDFGIVPLEAQACGRPVVALGRGGALETIVDRVTGVLVDDPSPAAFAEGIRAARGLSVDPDALHAHADRFSRDRFKTDMAAHIEETFTAPAGSRW